MKNYAILTLLALSFFGLNACNSDDDAGENSSPQTNLMPQKFTYAGKGSEIFMYNNDKNITKYTYNVGDEFYQYSFTYINQKLANVIYEDLNNPKKEYIVYYESEGTIKIEEKENNAVVETNYLKINSDGSLRGDLEGNSFTYSGRNLSNWIADGVVKLSFDYYTDQASYFRNVRTPSWVFTFFNLHTLAKNKNQLKSYKEENGTLTNFTYSDFQIENFPRNIDISKSNTDEVEAVKVTYTPTTPN